MYFHIFTVYLSILQYIYCSLVLIRKVEENISLFLFFTSWASIDLVPSKEFLFLKSISKNNHKSIFPDQIKSPSVFSTAIKAAIRCCLAKEGESIDHPEDKVKRIFPRIFTDPTIIIFDFNPIDVLWENGGDWKIRECHNKLFDCSCRHSITKSGERKSQSLLISDGSLSEVIWFLLCLRFNKNN